MQRVILQKYSETFAVNDDPDFTHNGLAVYKMLSSYDEIALTLRGQVLGRYVHIALSSDRLFVYDVENRECRGSLGPYELQFVQPSKVAMTHCANTRDGLPVDATAISSSDWEALKLSTQLGDFVMSCCKAPAVLKTSINGLPFFAHVSDECATAAETQWHRAGKSAVLAALHNLGIDGREEAAGQSPSGSKWKADVLFTMGGRTIAIELQRSYQHLRDFTRRQDRYMASKVECYWLVPRETFLTLSKATVRVLLKREFGGMFPAGGVGTGMLPELPIAMLDAGDDVRINFGGFRYATVQSWLEGVLNGNYLYQGGSWALSQHNID